MDIPSIKITRVLQCKDCQSCDERGKEAYCYQRKILVKADARACKNVIVRKSVAK